MTPNGKSAIFQVKFRFPKRKDFIENLKVFIFCDLQSAHCAPGWCRHLKNPCPGPGCFSRTACEAPRRSAAGRSPAGRFAVPDRDSAGAAPPPPGTGGWQQCSSAGLPAPGPPGPGGCRRRRRHGYCRRQGGGRHFPPARYGKQNPHDPDAGPGLYRNRHHLRPAGCHSGHLRSVKAVRSEYPVKY